jgi:hypothetical protein
MTIAAGFVYRDGVMLCADTLIQMWPAKLYGMKIAPLTGPWGEGRVACSGSYDRAAAAVDKCRDALLKARHKSPLDVIKETVKRHYADSVMKHPHYGVDHGLPYSLLFALRFGSDRCRLYVTEETDTREIDTYRAIGAGGPLGLQLSAPLYRLGMTEKETAALAGYVLSTVKDNVDGCGGRSILVSIRHDGSIVEFMTDASVELDLAHADHFAGEFNKRAAQLFVSHISPDLNDAEFEARFADFFGFVGWLREQRKAATPAAQPDPQSTTADPSPRPPLQE